MTGCAALVGCRQRTTHAAKELPCVLMPLVTITHIATGMILFALALGGCAGPPATQAPTAEPIATLRPPATASTAQPTLVRPTATPKPTIVSTPTKADIKDGIQQTLNQYA